MNKDVIYIEAEDDITDILAKIKNAKNKIVALVPPKKAGVLHSAVNFKLITKTATKAEKSVVLVSSDESLTRLAGTANIPVAKTLQSKPRVPQLDDAVEFGEADDNPVIEAESDIETGAKKIEVKSDEEASASPKEAKAAATKKTTKAAAAKKTPAEDDDIIEEEKPTRKKTASKVPNFKKYQKLIIAGVVGGVALIIFLVWALVFAPAVKIVVSMNTTPVSFAEKVDFTEVEENEDIDKGILYVESKSVTKSTKGEFQATGSIDKGEKATGTVTVKVNSPVSFDGLSFNKTITVPSGTSFTYNGLKYISSNAATIKITRDNVGDATKNCKIVSSSISCNLASDATATISVVAAENGEKYNRGATTSGWTSGAGAVSVTSSSAMVGGTSKVVKIVSANDLSEAEASLDMSIDNEARDELTQEFGDDYVLISSSFNSGDSKVSTSPAVNEEVGDGVTPQIVKEIKYTIFAVRKDDVERYITKIAEETMLGDDTQMIHDTGIDNAFVDGFKDAGNGVHNGKIKATVKTGPKISEEIVLEKSLGRKLGEVQTMIKSIKGVSKVELKPSYFWVSSVPNDANKVTIEINAAEE